ncbi:hypothetical protein Ddye_009778 [Dipteronia dyeriana]|uniref:Uncharacterized protein n=1 Tax=Dipteronia dyeriana TaxID=168575 RepID=A0AAE0CMN2_9ROSI|nr:hypothetical protein Ddye_009778 [Dipteronia dyeriana]
MRLVRLLRGVRIAARFGFKFAGLTGCWLLKLADELDNTALMKARMRQQNSMLLNGNARNSLILASQFGVVGKLPWINEDYFLANGIGETNMLLELFNQLDKLVETPQRPCTIEFKNAIIAFHSAILESPQHPKVIFAFCLALHEKKILQKSIERAEKSNTRGGRFSELKKGGSVDVERELMDFVLGPLTRNIEKPGMETDPIFNIILEKCSGLRPRTHGRPTKLGVRFSDDLALVISNTLFPYN